MKYEIRFKGLSLDRDELAAQNGELALCAGVELHDGALRPSVLDGTVKGNAAMGRGCTLVYVHSGYGESYPHYIGKYVSGHNISLYWFDKDMDGGDEQNINDHLIHTFDDHYHKIQEIKSVGNALCFLCSDGIHYALFKDDGNTEGYMYIDRIPELDMQFGLVSAAGGGNIKEINVTLQGSDYDYLSPNAINIKEEDQARVTEAIMAEINQDVYHMHEDGYFVFPFFVRYAIRLYDGSLIRHSAPILMMPNGNVHPSSPASVDGSKFSYRPIAGYSLSYLIPEASQLSDLLKVSDIVKSVDIFLSAPLYTYNQSGLCKRLVNHDAYNDESRAYGFSASKSPGSSTIYGSYDKHQHIPYTNSGVYKKIIELPQLDEDIHPVENNSNFFLYRSISIKELSSDSNTVIINPKVGDITTITTKQQMTDDYDSHDVLIPKGGYLYNARLNLFEITKRKFAGFHPTACFNLTNASERYIISCFVHITNDLGTVIVNRFSGDFQYSEGGVPKWFYYPDPNATKAIWIVRKIEGSENSQDPVWQAVEIYELPLKPHKYLNGSYWFDDYYPPEKVADFTDAATTLDPHRELEELVNDGYIVHDLRDLDNSQAIPDSCKPFSETNAHAYLPHTVYTSKTNNPFFFPNLIGEAGINNVGTGVIKGMSTVTRALSTGQVGDHDLVIFSTDGIWVLKVGTTGIYTQAHNISRDVCVNPESICQLDQSVIFATDRALCRFIESNDISISDTLDGPIQDFKAMMRSFYDLFDIGGVYASDVDMKKLLDFSTDAISYFTEGKVIYDYESKRLLILPHSVSFEESNVAFVFSITDQTWSTMAVPALKTIIPGYPHPYYQLSDGKVYSLNVPYPQKENTPSYSTGIIITRTLAFSDTMDVIQGFQQLCDCANKPQLFLYGSNDQRTWTFIGNSGRDYANYLPGHPFRYFRAAMYFSMSKTERYQELLLDIVNKYAKL